MLWILIVTASCIAAQMSSARDTSLVATGQLAEWTAEHQNADYDAGLTFLTNDTIGLQICHFSKPFNCPLLIVLRIYESGFRVVARREISEPPLSLFRTDDGGMLTISNSASRCNLFSNALNPKYEFQCTPMSLSVSGKTAAMLTSEDQWTIFRICPSLECTEEAGRVSGELVAVSDDTIVRRDHDTMRVQTIQGMPTGAFKVKSAAKCFAQVQIVAPGRIFLTSCGPDRIIDVNGKELARIPQPKGWGFRRGWSDDGTRLLYDHATRTVSALKSLGELTVAVATLGLGVGDETDNGELVRVVDANTGKTCFDWKGPLGPAAAVLNHADISPSGEKVAVLTKSALLVYRLPRDCAGS